MRPALPRVPAVYPRVCGGGLKGEVALTLNYGLSPRVRGRLECGPRFLEFLRSIPACAGEALRTSDCLSSNRVYPRVCGGGAI